VGHDEKNLAESLKNVFHLGVTSWLNSSPQFRSNCGVPKSEEEEEERMRKTFLTATAMVATLVVSLALQGVSLHGMIGDDDDHDDGVTNLRALWHFDKFLTLTAPPQVTPAVLTPDSTENGNTGNVIDGAARVPDGGEFDDGIALTTTGFVEAGHDPTLEPKFVTAELWVKAPTPGTNAYLLSKGIQACSAPSYSLNRASDTLGNLHFDVFNGTTLVRSPGAPSASVFNTAFHHVAGTYDGATVKIFVDGVQVDGGTVVPLTFGNIKYDLPNGRDLYLGRYNGPGCTLPFTGILDETRIWARALSGPELLVSADMGLQNVGGPGGFRPEKIGVAEDASDVFTKEWEITGVGATNPITVHFDIVTQNPATVITPLGIVVTKAKNALVSSVVNPGLLAGKGYLITVTRIDVTKAAEVKFEADLTDGADVSGKISIKP
jgi:hypothetical protein